MQFKGVHSDIGGGNDNSKRSNIALNWMLDEATKAGVEIDSTKRALDKYAQIDWDAPISENKDVVTDSKRVIPKSVPFHPSAKSRNLDIGEPHSVNTVARLKFNWARVSLKEGQQYKIWTNKSDTWDDAAITCNASGWKSEELGFLKESVVKVVEKKRRCPDADWFELVGAYDNDKGLDCFRIGEGTTFTAERDGELYLYANDLNTRYANNAGLIRVFIERVA